MRPTGMVANVARLLTGIVVKCPMEIAGWLADVISRNVKTERYGTENNHKLCYRN